jgi:hypothetical protein
MAIMGIQIVGLLFGIFMIYITFVNRKRKDFTLKEGLAWIVMWLGIMFVALFPNALDFLVKRTLKLQRPLDFFIIMGFIFMLFISFYTYSLIRKIQRKQEEIVRKIAIERK